MRLFLFLALYLLGAGTSLAAIFEDISQLPSRSYDFIVAGGGNAGLVVASRLSEDPRVKVLVLEAGPSYFRHHGMIELEVPWLASRFGLIGDPVDWNTSTTPQPGLNGRTLHYFRARVLGGSSSHHGMIWIRGSSDDYDKWAKATGDKGWSWQEMLPYLKKTERWTKAPGHGPEEGDFDPRVHGFKGLLGVGLNNAPSPTDPLVIQTTKDLPDEFHFIEDANAGRPIGVVWTQFSIANGTRCSSATAFLDPFLDRPNLSVLIGAYVTRVLQTSGGSFRTVEFAQNKTSPRHRVTASKEVIISSGAVGTPQVLMNSGIGDSDILRRIGIKPIFHLPSVGKNFTTQPSIGLVYGANTTVVNLNTNQTASDEALQQWISSRTGPMTGAGVSISAYFRLPRNSPVLAAHGDPSAGPNTPHFSINLNANGYFSLSPTPVLTARIGLSEPASRGSIVLRSNDPFELPLVDVAAYSAPVDIAIIKAAYGTVQRFVHAPAWRGFTLDRIAPPPNVISEADFEQFVRNSSGVSYHGIGSSAMSPRGARYGVVDPDLSVKGISGLRIVDASVIPFIPSANTQAPVYAVAERASDLIKRAWRLE